MGGELVINSVGKYCFFGIWFDLLICAWCGVCVRFF